ncbi:MAG: 2-oxo-4-hydroxy-4-carboxy-5-ureidoimidazoline decarboxylase, partial [Mycobacterium sp.]|nr:2-oxo-4-hydroxy-4-carboxy-5-ureidoimidazoline decarboxylase [Mycobacterium sp.]
MSSGFEDDGVLLHQGIGLDAFNALPERKAVHALYECCNSMVLARDLARGRAYDDHDALFRRADSMLFALSEAT